MSEGGSKHGALSLRDVTKMYGDVLAVDRITLDVHPGEFVTLLGPSGSGKTTTLRIIAGLVANDSGAVVLDGEELTGLPPHKRDMGVVFQNYALFPHLTAAQNLAFPLEMRRVIRSEIRRRVHEALQLVGLSGFEGRYPRQLSGGQQQRVALARAIIFAPHLLLMDEPLGALDRKLRERLQLEIVGISRRLGITVLYVTHDQEEALVMSDRIAVYNHGQIEQVGTGEDLYERPASLFVADFVGESNVLHGVLEADSGGSWIALDGGHRVHVSEEARRRPGLSSGSRGAIVVRPERMRVWIDSGPGPLAVQASARGALAGVLHGTVREVIYLGAVRKYVIQLATGRTALARVPVGQALSDLSPGASVLVGWDTEHGVLVADGERVSGAAGGAGDRTPESTGAGAERWVGSNP